MSSKGESETPTRTQSNTNNSQCTLSLPFHHEFLLTKDCRITTSTEFRDVTLPQLVKEVESIVSKRLKEPLGACHRDDFTYQTVSIEPCINEKFAKEFRDRYTNSNSLHYGNNTKTRKGKECRYMAPTLVYHGARSQRIIDSIAKRGFLHQGEHLDGTALSVPEYPVLYGDGIYCSKDLDVARLYSNGGIVVGLCYQGCQVTFNASEMRSINRHFDEDVDSRFIPASDILVVKESTQILPLLMIREERIAKVFQKYCASLTKQKPGEPCKDFGNEIYFRQLTHGYWEINLNSFLKQKINSQRSVEAEIEYLTNVNNALDNAYGSYQRLPTTYSDEFTPARKKTLLSQLDIFFGSSRATPTQLRRFDIRRVHKRVLFLIETSGMKDLISVSHAFSTLAQQCKNLDEIAVLEVNRSNGTAVQEEDSLDWIAAPLKKNPVQLGKSSIRNLCSGIDLIYSEIALKKYELGLKFREFVEQTLFVEEAQNIEQLISLQDMDRLLTLFQSRLKFDVVCFSKFDLPPDTWLRTKHDQATCREVGKVDDEAAWLKELNECISKNSADGNHGTSFIPIISSPPSSYDLDGLKDHIAVRNEIAAFLSIIMSGSDIPHYDKLKVHIYEKETFAGTNENPFATVVQDVVEELNKYDTSCFQNMVLPVEFEGHGRGFVNDLLTSPARCATDCFLYYGGVAEGCVCPSSVRLMLPSLTMNKKCGGQGETKCGSQRETKCDSKGELDQLRCFQCQHILKGSSSGYSGFVPPYIFINGEQIGVRISTSRLDFTDKNSYSSTAFQTLRRLRERQEKSLRRSLGGLVRKKQAETAQDQEAGDESQYIKVTEKVNSEVLLRDELETFEEIVNFFSDFSAGNDFVSHLAWLGGALKVAVIAHHNDNTTKVLKPRKQMANVDASRLLLKDWCKCIQRSDVLMKNPHLVAELMQLLTVVEEAKTNIQSVIRKNKLHTKEFYMDSGGGGTETQNKLSISANQLIARAAQSLTLCPSRSSFLKERHLVVNALQECLNEIQKVYLVKTLPVEEWQTSLKEMKYATQAVRRARADIEEDNTSKESDPHVESHFVWPDGVNNESIKKVLGEPRSDIQGKELSISDGSVASELTEDAPRQSDTEQAQKWAYSGIAQKQDLERFAELVKCGMANSPLDLASHGMVGLMVDVFRHDASNVDPWKLLVRNVGFNSYEDTAMAYCHAKLKAPLTDSKGNLMSDVVVLLPPPKNRDQNDHITAQYKEDKLHELDSLEATDLQSQLRFHARRTFIKSAFYRSYLALVFTRNPWLEVPGQTLAITCITWVKLAEKLMLLGDEGISSAETVHDKKSSEITSHNCNSSLDMNTADQFAILYQQYQAVGCTIKELIQSTKNRELICSIRQNCLSGDPLKLTEKFGVSSLCLALTAIVFGGQTHSSSPIDWKDNMFMRSVFLLLAEAIARAAKIYLKFEYENEVNRKGSTVSQLADVSRILIQRVVGACVDVSGSRDIIKKPDSSTQDEKKRKGRSKPFHLQHHHLSRADCVEDQSKRTCLLKVDRAKALSESARFFQYVAPNHPRQKNLITNCTPHALAATLLLHSSKSEQILQKVNSVEEKRSWLSMGAFFNKLVKQPNPDNSAGSQQKTENSMKEDLQISLYLQGIAYFASHLRSNVAFSDNIAGNWKNDPEKIWAKILSTEEALQRSTLEKQLTNANKVEARVKHQLQTQEDFITGPHSALPRMFTADEIKALNQTRPADDQLQLDPLNGLLRHHCASPSCPSFLVDLRTDGDRRRGTNQGLWKHLQCFHVPHHHRLPTSSFHRILVGHLPEKYDRLSKDQYADVMMERYQKFYGPDRMGKDFQIEFIRKSIHEQWEKSFNQ